MSTHYPTGTLPSRQESRQSPTVLATDETYARRERPDPKPTTEAQAFDAFDDDLDLDPDERHEAIEIHHEIAETLSAEEYVDGHFLQGSLRRKTMVKPLRDIDMVVTLTAPFAKGFAGELVEMGIRASADGDAGPAAAMLALQSALEPHYPIADFDMGKHALTIDFGNDSFKFDVVPALDEGDDVLIANTDTGRWERSNTRQLILTVATRNQGCNGRFVHQVRMIKHAVKQHPDISGDFFGLLSESIAYHAVTESLPHAKACAEIFRVGAELLGGTEILDPTGEDNLLAKLPTDVKVDARRVFVAWRDKANEARHLTDAGDQDAAIDIWHNIFGEVFPKAAGQTTATAAKIWNGGGLTSGGRVTRITSNQVAPPSRSWRS